MKKISRLILAFICAATALLFSGCQKSDKTKIQKSVIGFYGINKTVQNAIEAEFKSGEEKLNAKFVFETVSEENLFSSKNKKYDAIFLINGKTAQTLCETGNSFSNSQFKKLPVNFKTNEKILPVLLDHYEASFYRPKRENSFTSQIKLPLPDNYSDLKKYLSRSQKLIQIPSVCAGRDDDELYGFVSNMALSLLGTEKYIALTEEIYSSKNLLLPEDLITVLDEIKSLQNENLILKNWYEASPLDVVRYYVPERNTSTLFMSLSLHRQINENYIKYFETTEFPKNTENLIQGIIAPEVCAVNLNKKNSASKIFDYLISEDVQEKLSDATGLAPVNRQSYSHDSQAYNVRYWSAGYKNGPLPHLGKAAFTSSSDEKIFAQKIRNYLK